MSGSDILKAMEPCDECADIVLNSLSANIAILEENGLIIKTNQAWQRFARENGMPPGFDFIGINYLEICSSAFGDSTETANLVSDGIRTVISGEIDEFATDYPCHSPEEKRWFYVRATRLDGLGPTRVVVSHENVTVLKLTEEALRERELELEIQRQNLEDANTALKVLLKNREEDRRDLEERILFNVKEIISPFMAKLKDTKLNPQQRAFVDTAESHLEELTSPFLQNVHLQFANLTPREIQIAILVKEGRATKEIAEMLNITANAVDFHRKSIRKKLGLNSKKSNLRSHLLSFAV
jgi:DNA-binding CsgD family transcriptional regulator